MRVFITGATGYIGLNVALAFRRAGHEVWGLVRTEEKAQRLLRHEIHPVVGDMQKLSTYVNAAENCSILVHTAFDMKSDAAAVDRATVETLIGLGTRGPKPRTLIYTSGVWLCGNTGDTAVDETVPPAPAKLVSWRPSVEETVLNASAVRGVVVRPGCVYGRQGGLTGMWFASAAKDGAVRAIGDGNNRWTMIHADDLADGYVRVAESGLAHEIFHLTDRSRASIRDMAFAAARAAGCPGKVTFVPLADAARQMGDFAECLALDQHVDSRKAVRLLGWQPRHSGFVDTVDLYYAAWKAHQS